MRLTAIHLLRYHLPLLRPLHMMGAVQKQRNGALVKLIFDDGTFGLGDLAPFPGLHRETLDDAVSDLIRTAPALSAYAASVSKLTQICPSLHFALDAALLDARARRRQLPAAQLLNPDYVPLIPVNGLLTGSLDEIRQKIKEDPTAGGMSCLKIKVAVRSMNDDIALLHFLDKTLAPDIRLRLDANRGWNWEQALYFTKHIPNARIDYIEEPLDCPERLDSFYQAAHLPIALDESLASGQLPALFPGLKALIIKPSVLGSLAHLQSLARFAKKHKLDFVLSSVFESGVGLRMLAHIAAAHGVGPQGFDTWKWLRRDITRPAFSIIGSGLPVAFCRAEAYQLLEQNLEKEIIAL